MVETIAVLFIGLQCAAYNASCSCVDAADHQRADALRCAASSVCVLIGAQCIYCSGDHLVIMHHMGLAGSVPGGPLVWLQSG